MRKFTKIVLCLMLAVTLISGLALTALAADYTLADGMVEVTVSGQTSKSQSNGVVTVTAKGSIVSKKTATVTIANSSGKEGILTFGYEASSYNAVKVNGASASASGSFSQKVSAGASVQ